MWWPPVHPNCYKFFFAFFYCTRKIKMSNLSTKERKAKFNKLSNDLNIKLIKGNRNFMLYMTKIINSGENLRKKSIDVSIQTKQMAFYSDLPFGILSLSSYVNIESMNIIFSYVHMNVYQLLGIGSRQMVNAFRLLEKPLF